MGTVKLYYFDVRARGELIRMILSYGKQDFQDIRFQGDEWPKFKAEAPFGQVPYIEYNGKKYGQSVALANYFAREFGLYGKTNVDALRIDEVMGLYQDIWGVLVTAYYHYSDMEKDKEAELQRKAKEEQIPKTFGYLNDLLKQNSPNGVYVGSDLTLADLTVYDMLYSMAREDKYDAGAASPELQALKDKVEAHPKLTAYFAARKDEQF